MKLIYDCDNTFGVKNCDVDDGLALIYLLAVNKLELIGITATYGNSQTDIVYENTKRMLKDLKREDITLKRGGLAAKDFDNEASIYLADMAKKYAGKLKILATGSMTNIAGAYMLDNNFFNNVSEIVLMGGITEDLVFKKKIMDELNLSCDPLASYIILKYAKNLSIVTGNNCMKVLFYKDEYRQIIKSCDKPIARYIMANTDEYFGYNDETYGIDGFYNWDVSAACYISHKELFEDKKAFYNISEEDLKRGYLREAADGAVCINLPEIREEEAFKDNIYKYLTLLDI